MKQITTVGIDLAKSVFQIHAVDGRGRVVLRKQLQRKQVAAFFANLPPCLIAIEACGSSHYWARTLSEYGHSVKLMPPQYVKPYVKTNKHDAADAEAISEAVSRPNMRFVAVKTPEQQSLLALHRAREGFIKARTAQTNQIRGLLSEFGLVIPKGIGAIARALPECLEDAENGLPGTFRALLARLGAHLRELTRQVRELEGEIQQWHRHNAASLRLEKVPGIGPLTASALVASVGDVSHFKNARQLAAWLGLVPRQHATGGKPLLLGISKHGDGYVRKLLIHGARSVVRVSAHKAQPDPWLEGLLRRRHKNVPAVALANKNARIAWALLAHDRDYEPSYAPRLAH